eukprot:6475984-Amphidinium_carterae.1
MRHYQPVTVWGCSWVRHVIGFGTSQPLDAGRLDNCDMTKLLNLGFIETGIEMDWDKSSSTHFVLYSWHDHKGRQVLLWAPKYRMLCGALPPSTISEQMQDYHSCDAFCSGGSPFGASLLLVPKLSRLSVSSCFQS